MRTRTGGTLAVLLPLVLTGSGWVQSPAVAAVNTDRLVPEATLSTPSAPFPPVFEHAVAAHGILAASAPGPQIDIFVKPPNGWSPESPPGVLTAANGVTLGPIAVSGEYVFAGADGDRVPGAVYVFRRPVGGWSGTIHEVATLLASDATDRTQLGWSVAASGRTVVASGARSTYVFTEPSGGWAGQVFQSAKLAAGDGLYSSVAVSGQTAIVSDPSATIGSHASQGAVFVFQRPAGGWTRTVRPTAKLTASDGKAFDQLGRAVMSGTTIAASSFRKHVYIFSKPKHGWAGTQHQDAERTLSGADIEPPALAASGPTIAIMSVQGDNGMHACPCPGDLFAITRPTSGWSGTRELRPSRHMSTLDAVTIDRSTLFATADDGIHIYRIVARTSEGPR